MLSTSVEQDVDNIELTSLLPSAEKNQENEVEETEAPSEVLPLESRPSGDTVDRDQLVETVEKRRTFWYLNFHLLPIKLFYFIFMLGGGCLFPFLTVYFRYVGLSASQNGIVQGFRPFVNFVATPLWGIIGDRLKKIKVIWMGSIVSFILFTALLGFIRPDTKTEIIHNICNCTLNPANFSQQNLSLVFDSSNLTLTSLCVEVKENRFDVDLVKFLQLASLVAVGEFLAAPVLSLADYFAIQLLGNKLKGDYGKQRLWGAVGWGIGAAAAGFAANSESPCDVKYTLLFIIFVCVASLGIPAAIFVRPKSESEMKDDDGSGGNKMADDGSKEIGKAPFFSRFKVLFSNPYIIAFLVAMWVLAMFMILIDNFLFWFLQDLHGGQVVLGLSLLFTCIGEVPVFFVSGFIIARIGHSGIIYVVFITYALRFTLYSFLTNPWTVLPIELLHGVTFALMWAASTTYARKIAPAGLEASIQTILAGVYWGLGRGCGGVLGGIAWERFGARTTFRGAAVLAVIGCVLYWVVRQLISKWKKEFTPLKCCCFSKSAEYTVQST